MKKYLNNIKEYRSKKRFFKGVFAQIAQFMRDTSVEFRQLRKIFEKYSDQGIMNSISLGNLLKFLNQDKALNDSLIEFLNDIKFFK